MTILLAVALTVAGPASVSHPAVSFEPGTRAGEAMTAAAAYVTTIDTANVAAVEAFADGLLTRTAELVYALEHPPPPPPAPSARSAPVPLPGASGGGGGCYDGPIPAYIVTRESGGNPQAVNASSGAYGCFQIMPYVWDANCSGLDRGVAGQIECANRISNGGTNLRPWSG
jgi:hypothetical protein